MPAARCPTCRRETSITADNPFRPFCSDRCKKIDLGAWFEERYRIPGAPVSTDPDAGDRDEDEV